MSAAIILFSVRGPSLDVRISQFFRRSRAEKFILILLLLPVSNILRILILGFLCLYFRHLKLKFLTQSPASNDEKKILMYISQIDKYLNK